MELIADGLLIATGLTAALYCFVLSQRLRRLTDARSGIGGQIEALSQALDETRAALAETRKGVTEARSSARSALDTLTREIAAARDTIADLEQAALRADDAADRARDAGTPPAGGSEAVGTGPGDVPDPIAPDREPEARDSPTAAEEDEDDIPDWPDGVIPSPDDDAGASAPARQEASPLRVERMAL